MLRMIVKTTKQFPYSGTSSSIGPGKIIYVTVCSIVVAFIFLPSSFFYEERTKSSADENPICSTNQSGSHNEKSGSQWGSGLSKRQHELEKQYRKDKRFVVTLARTTFTWRVFPLPIGRFSSLTKDSVAKYLLSFGSFPAYYYDFRPYPHPANRERVFAALGGYTPVFCLEIACWLLEVSWQAYYSPFNYPRMSLENYGLNLESEIWDEVTDTHAFVFSNTCDQVDGKEDSIIVVAFRGTSNLTHLGTDLQYQQVCYTTS